MKLVPVGLPSVTMAIDDETSHRVGYKHSFWYLIKSLHVLQNRGRGRVGNWEGWW